MMRHRPAAAIVDRTAQRALALVQKWVGITLSGAAPRRLYDFLEQRSRQLELPGAAHYVDLLEHASTHDPEVGLLINLVTNGLTAFWRDEPQLGAVRLVLEQIAQDRNISQDPITIWCAGCSTGEEAYTLAMVAMESGLNARVLGSDVNTEYLNSAMHGMYHAWSLRRLSEARRARYFSEPEPGLFAISPHLKERVSFQKHNLMSHAPEPPRRSGWDVVVCRNVLIYFEEDVVRGVIKRFAESLQHDGYLMLGSSEHMTAYFDEANSPFRAARHGAGFVYRLSSKLPGTTVYKVPLVREPHPLGQGAPPEPVPESLLESSEATVEVPSTTITPELIEAGCAMLSDNTEFAMACFESVISYDPFATDAHYAMAYLLLQNDPHQAMDALRKLLFLKPLHWLAAYQLATLHEANGAPLRARSLYRQALEGLAQDADLFELPALKTHFEPTARQRARLIAHCKSAVS